MYIPLWIIVIGVVVYFFWAKNKKEKPEHKKEATPPLNDKRTSLNPLFSEEEIARKKETADKWQEYVVQYFDELFNQEKEEVEAHQKSGKDNATFKPSEKLIGIIQKQSMSLLGRNNAMKDYRKMIESNIAIINGGEIEKVEKTYWDQMCHIPYDNFDIIYNPNIYLDDKEMKEMYNSNMEHRKKFWKDSWDYILKKEYVQKED
jgi:hypothetical protein